LFGGEAFAEIGGGSSAVPEPGNIALLWGAAIPVVALLRRRRS